MTDHTDLLEQVFEINLNSYGPEDAERLAFAKACRDELAKRKPEPAAETVGGLAKAVKAARGGDAPPAPMRRFA